MALESISFLTYFLARLPADDPADDNTLLIQQGGDTVCQITFADFAQALAAEAGSGAPVVIVGNTTLTAAHGRVLVNAPAGTEVVISLPTYGSVSLRKGYQIKNIGLGSVRIEAIDSKLIDDGLTVALLTGDRCGLCKDGTNWQII